MQLQCNKTRVCKAEVRLCPVNSSRINADSSPEHILCLINGKLLCGGCQGINFLIVYLETSVMVPSEPDSNASAGEREALNLDNPMGVTEPGLCCPPWGHQELGYPCGQRVQAERWLKGNS